MKKTFRFLSIFLVIFGLMLTGCKEDKPTPPPANNVAIDLIRDSIEIKVGNIPTFDFTGLFSINENGKNVVVLPEYIDTSELLLTPGSYKVYCNYKDKKAYCTVIVKGVEYLVTSSVDEIMLNVDEVENYDFLSLFEAFVDNRKVGISLDMVTENVESKVGNYKYTVTFGDASKSIDVIVTDLHEILIVPAYHIFELESSKLNDFDFTKLFNVYVDGKIKPVTKDLLDLTEIVNLKVGDTATVKINYQAGQSQENNQIIIKIVPDEEVMVRTKNIVTYPNEEYIDLTTLFEITKGDKIIPVSLDMISGKIDYQNLGINEITLTYDGKTYISTVEIKRGVVIKYHTSNVINITKGTNSLTYPFMDDFEVIINGIRFDNLSYDYLDLSKVDFNTKGVYPVTLKIPYNDKKLGLSGPKFTYYEASINYVVVENDYEINLKEELVTLKEGNTNFNVYSNLLVYINSKKQTLTEVKEYVDSISCYVETLSEDIKFDVYSPQEVKIAVYVDGPNANPVIVTYQVVIDAKITITPNNMVVFTGTNLHKKDLFTVTKNRDEIEITDDMVEGILDTFTPGTYRLSINYENIIKDVVVTVYDNDLKGTYRTNLTTFDDRFGMVQEETFIPRRIASLVIGEDGSLEIDHQEAIITEGIDVNNLKIAMNNSTFTLHHENGIIVIIPDNPNKMRFTNRCRPLIYFNEDVWDINYHLEINHSNYVLECEYVTKSMDLFSLTNKLTNEEIYYGLMTRITGKMGPDTVYKVTYGQVLIPEGFELKAGANTSFIFDRETYYMNLITTDVANFTEPVDLNLYANKTFTGKINGLPAELRCDRNESMELFINSEFICRLSPMEIDSLKNGGVNYDTNEIFLYDSTKSTYSYKFIVDKDNNTFTYVEKDDYYGKYVKDDMYIFMDGYGTGCANFAEKYYITEFKYNVVGNSIEFDFKNPRMNFQYNNLVANIDEYFNVLNIQKCDEDAIIGANFTKENIFDGIIVHIKSTKIGKNPDSIAKKELYANIEIITKDGIVADQDKSLYIDTSKISFSKPGFYQLVIKGNVKGNMIESYYAIEVLDNKYEGNSLVATYGQGVMLEDNSFMINKYGVGILNTATDVYQGVVEINPDNTFIFRASSEKGKKIVMSGEKIAEGLIFVKCTGTVVFNDYFTTGTTKYIGCAGSILREITLNNEVIYLYAVAANMPGNNADVELLKGTSIYEKDAIVKISALDKEIIVKVNSWNNLIRGYEISDKFRGTYQNESGNTVTLDGFGNVTMEDNTGTYMMNDDNATICVGVNTYVYKLNPSTKTFEVVNIKLDNSILEGKTFESKYLFMCNEYGFDAITKFSFETNGVVTIYTESPEHDSADGGCGLDKYAAPFGSKEGTAGTYLVSGNKVSITVNGISFTFVINNVMNPKFIKCIATTCPKDAHGYFGINTIFNSL